MHGCGIYTGYAQLELKVTAAAFSGKSSYDF